MFRWKQKSSYQVLWEHREGHAPNPGSRRRLPGGMVIYAALKEETTEHVCWSERGGFGGGGSDRVGQGSGQGGKRGDERKGVELTAEVQSVCLPVFSQAVFPVRTGEDRWGQVGTGEGRGRWGQITGGLFSVIKGTR